MCNLTIMIRNTVFSLFLCLRFSLVRFLGNKRGKGNGKGKKDHHDATTRGLAWWGSGKVFYKF